MKNILVVLVFRYTHLIPQIAIWTPFRASVTTISHLDLFGFNPEKNENCSKICMTSITEIPFLRKEFSVISTGCV